MNADRRRKRRPAPAEAKRAISLRPIAGGGGHELVHPRGAVQRAEDLEEVHQMLEAGEHEIARDELRWLIDGCPGLLEAHQLLGEIALAENDWELARTHFGYAYELGAAALPAKGQPVRLPCACPANQPFFVAGKGLVLCLKQLGEPMLAAEVAVRLISLDPLDPLGVRQLLD